MTGCIFEECGEECESGTPYCAGHLAQERREEEIQAALRRGEDVLRLTPAQELRGAVRLLTEARR